ncbi:hypothetical protein Tco_0904258 [Tanacetum coccineum]
MEGLPRRDELRGHHPPGGRGQWGREVDVGVCWVERVMMAALRRGAEGGAEEEGGYCPGRFWWGEGKEFGEAFVKLAFRGGMKSWGESMVGGVGGMKNHASDGAVVYMGISLGKWGVKLVSGGVGT